MEKTLFAQTGEIRGKKTPEALTVSFQFAPDQEQLKKTRGAIFLLINLKGNEEKALGQARGLFESFKDSFYAAAGSNLKAMEEALEVVKGSAEQQGLELSLVAANLWGSVLYVTKIGEAGVILVRSKNAKKIEITKVASGNLFDKDDVILADPAFLETSDLTLLGTQISGEDFDESLKEVERAVKEKEGGAFGIRLSVQTPIETTQPLLIADLDKTNKDGGGDREEAGVTPEKKKPFQLPQNLKDSLKFFEGKDQQIKVYFGKAARITRELTRKASYIALSPWLPHPPGALEDPALRRRKRVFQIVVVLAVVLVASIVVGLFNHTRKLSKEKFETSISSVESKLKDAKNLGNINPNQARSYLVEAEKELEGLSASDPKVASLQKQLEALLAKINKIYKVKLETFADLGALKGGIDSKELKFTGNYLFVLDKGTGSIYKVGVGDAQPSILVSEKKGLQTFTATGDFVYLQTKSGIIKVDSETANETSMVGASSDWKGLIEADSYRNNLYLLDKGAKQIWKYLPAGAGLAGPNKYLTQDFKEVATSFAIDGAIWVSSKNKLFKFFGGNQDKFSVKNTPKRFGNIVDIYTKESQANLYVLDQDGGGVFVIKKTNGEYIGFYEASQMSGADALVVNEAKKIVYILADNTISAFKLK